MIITQLHTSNGKVINNNPNPKPCDPSWCGEIRNISYPFRLNTDLKHCGHPKYELSCENNTTSLYLNSQKYLVKVINYHNSTIRLTDAAIQNDDICSFPKHSLSASDFGDSGYTYSIKRYDRKSHAITWPMTFVSCPYDPVVNNSQYPHVLDTSHCSDSKYSYVKLGALNGSYVMDLCRIDLMVMTSLNMKSDALSNLSQVHSCLVYGFELSWFIVLCGGRCEDCGLNGETATCLQKQLIGQLWVLLQALYVIIDTAMGRFSARNWPGPGTVNRPVYLGSAPVLDIGCILTTCLGLRILIGLPSLFVLLIIKFRKRHLSLFSTIEAFLQSNISLTTTLTAVRGTIGYVAPELMNRSIGHISYKADVYGFGMLLMEMLGLNRGTRHNDNKSSQYFPYWIYDHLNEGNDIEIGNADKNDYDDDDDDDDNARKMRRKMTIVGLWCIQMSPTDRPSMSEVLKMLQGEIENLQIPPQPSQLPDIEYFNDRNWETESTGSMALLCNDSLTDQ
ncbi:hypothetical protein ABFS82_05G083800 [Erythranthe guttata]